VQDFTLAATPLSQTVTAGNANTNFTVTVGALNSFSANVAFTASGLPAGASPVFNPASFSGAGSTALTISTGGATPGGIYTVTINGISGSQTHSTNITFTVIGTNAPARPVILGVKWSGTNLIFNGTNGTAGSTFAVLASTNLATPLNQWTPLVTNIFGSGNFTVTNGVNPAAPKNFFLLRVP
jgi:hypothetical protein